jgi:outer membrane autotransporter protein
MHGSAGIASCTSGDIVAASYDGIPLGTFGVPPVFIVALPDPDRPAATNNVKIKFDSTGFTNENVTTVTCPSGTVTGVGTTLVQVALADGGSCSLFAAATINGTLVSYQAVLSRTGDSYTVGAGTATGGGFGGTVTLPDTTAPRLTAMVRQNPALSPTNNDTLTWRVTFDENVQNIDAGDFSVTGTTGSIAVATVTADSVFDITVSGGNLANLNATVTLGFDGGQNIQDTTGNALANTTPTGTNENTYQVINDADAPSVTISAPDTARGPFTVTITFSEDVMGFALADITVGNGTASNFAATSDSVYTALITPTAHGQVTIDVAAGVAQDAANNPNNAAAQATTNFIDEEFVRTRTQRVISNFMSRRGDQITSNDPALINRLNGGSNGAVGPVAFTGSGTLDQNKVAFSTSLRQIVTAGEASKAKKREELTGMMALGQQSLIAQPGGLTPGFDVWVEGKWAHVDDETRDSDIGLLCLGVDYRMSPDVLFGVLAQFDWTDEKDDTQNTSADGTGWMVGPYVAARLHQNLIFDGRAAWGQSDNDVSPLGTYTDSFDGDRWLLRGKFTGDFAQGPWSFLPHVGVIYFEETQESYTDTLGNFIPSQTVSLGRVTFGPKVGYRRTNPDGTTIAPYAAVKGIWDFEEAQIVDIASGLAVGSDEVRARFEGGIATAFANGWLLNGEGFYDGVGADDFQAYGGSVTLAVPLN